MESQTQIQIFCKMQLIDYPAGQDNLLSKREIWVSEQDMSDTDDSYGNDRRRDELIFELIKMRYSEEWNKMTNLDKTMVVIKFLSDLFKQLLRLLLLLMDGCDVVYR
jgi:hypothetical protein